jgi:hypothetical protein
VTMSEARVSSTMRPRPAALGDRVMNRLVNPITRGLLRSPLRRVLSTSTALVTYTGRRTGERATVVTRQLHELAGRTLTPVAARARAEETVVIAIDLDGGHEAADQPHTTR